MMELDWGVVITALVAIFGPIASYAASVRKTRHERETSSEKLLQETAARVASVYKGLLDTYKLELDEVKAQVARLQTQLDEANKTIRKLEARERKLIARIRELEQEKE